jgi:chemotaxis protein MotB
MPLARRARRRTLDIWPGFVDALATLLMVIIFVLLVFVLAQWFLGNALSGSERANTRLSAELAALADQLSLEKKANLSLNADLSRLSGQLTANTAERDSLVHDVAALTALKEELEAKLGASASSAEAERALLAQQIDTLQQQLAKVAAALDVSDKQVAEQKVQIADLGARLNVALASKVEELKKYRSEFLGRLRQVLGNRPGIRVEGDRFVFQSELLFDSASAELGLDGIEQIRQLAITMKQLDKEIPKDLAWVLRVDGHTDKRPINTPRYPSNWELSTARAIAVLRTLAANGIPPDRLAAAGFGEYQPLEAGDSDAAYAKNRRIEVRLDQR